MEDRRKSKSRRSSILKATRLPLEDVKPNNDETEIRACAIKGRRSIGRRVSFAEKPQIKEFEKQPHWNRNLQLPNENLSQPFSMGRFNLQSMPEELNIFSALAENPEPHKQDALLESHENNPVQMEALRKASEAAKNARHHKRKSFDIHDYIEQYEDAESTDLAEGESVDSDDIGNGNKSFAFYKTNIFDDDDMELTCQQNYQPDVDNSTQPVMEEPQPNHQERGVNEHKDVDKSISTSEQWYREMLDAADLRFMTKSTVKDDLESSGFFQSQIAQSNLPKYSGILGELFAQNAPSLDSVIPNLLQERLKGKDFLTQKKEMMNQIAKESGAAAIQVMQKTPATVLNEKRREGSAFSIPASKKAKLDVDLGGSIYDKENTFDSRIFQPITGSIPVASIDQYHPPVEDKENILESSSRVKPVVDENNGDGFWPLSENDNKINKASNEKENAVAMQCFDSDSEENQSQFLPMQILNETRINTFNSGCEEQEHCIQTPRDGKSTTGTLEQIDGLLSYNRNASLVVPNKSNDYPSVLNSRSIVKLPSSLNGETSTTRFSQDVIRTEIAHATQGFEGDYFNDVISKSVPSPRVDDGFNNNAHETQNFVKEGQPVLVDESRTEVQSGRRSNYASQNESIEKNRFFMPEIPNSLPGKNDFSHAEKNYMELQSNAFVTSDHAQIVERNGESNTEQEAKQESELLGIGNVIGNQTNVALPNETEAQFIKSNCPKKAGTFIISPEVYFQKINSETFSIPKNESNEFANDGAEVKTDGHCGGGSKEPSESPSKLKQTFVLPKMQYNVSPEGNGPINSRFSVGEIQRRAKDRMSWVSRETMIIASTPIQSTYGMQKVEEESASQLERTAFGKAVTVDNRGETECLNGNSDEEKTEVAQSTLKSTETTPSDGKSEEETISQRQNCLETMEETLVIRAEGNEEVNGVNAGEVESPFIEDDANEKSGALSLEHDQAYQSFVANLKKEKVEMEIKLAELSKALEEKQKQARVMEEVINDVTEERKDVDKERIGLEEKEQLLEEKRTVLDSIVKKNSDLRRQVELIEQKSDRASASIRDLHEKNAVRKNEESDKEKALGMLYKVANRLTAWSLLNWSDSHFEFSFFRFKLIVSFEGFDGKPLECQNVLKRDRKIKSIKLHSAAGGCNARSQFVASRLQRQIKPDLLVQRYKTTKNLNKMLHEVSMIVMAHRDLYKDLNSVHIKNNLSMQDEHILETKFASPPQILFTEFCIRCEVNDDDVLPRFDLSLHHLSGIDRTNTFQEIIDQAKSGPMIFSRTVMSVKDFITESHRNYFSTKQISESV